MQTDLPERELYLALKVVCCLEDLKELGIVGGGRYSTNETSYEAISFYESMGEKLPSRPEILWVLEGVGEVENRDILCQILYEYMHEKEVFDERLEKFRAQMFPDPEEYEEDEDTFGKPEDLC